MDLPPQLPYSVCFHSESYQFSLHTGAEVVSRPPSFRLLGHFDLPLAWKQPYREILRTRVYIFTEPEEFGSRIYALYIFFFVFTLYNIILASPD